MVDFRTYVQQADAEYKQETRDEPLILEQNGTVLTDPHNGTTFSLTEVLEAVSYRPVDDVGGGILVFFGKENIRIRFMEAGNA